jgi:hypothetical protein
VHGGGERVDHRLVAFLRSAELDDAGERGLERDGELRPAEFFGVAVPQRGPLAPPTVETSVAPAVVSSFPGEPSSPSSLPTTALKPRSMFVPWSASPIAASSCVR